MICSNRMYDGSIEFIDRSDRTFKLNFVLANITIMIARPSSVLMHGGDLVEL